MTSKQCKNCGVEHQIPQNKELCLGCLKSSGAIRIKPDIPPAWNEPKESEDTEEINSSRLF